MGAVESFENMSAAQLAVNEFLTFRLGGEEYGIDILKVQEIRGYENPTRIANAPHFIKGVVNLRGVIVPIIDMRLRFGLPEAAIQAIQQVLDAHPEVEQALVYGSRALGRQRPASDIDLTLTGPAISSGTLIQIEAELDDLLLPWMIDLSRLADLSHPPLLDHIARVGQVLYNRADRPD